MYINFKMLCGYLLYDEYISKSRDKIHYVKSVQLLSCRVYVACSLEMVPISHGVCTFKVNMIFGILCTKFILNTEEDTHLFPMVLFDVAYHITYSKYFLYLLCSYYYDNISNISIL